MRKQETRSEDLPSPKEDISKQVVITFYTSPERVPTTYFVGEWKGRDVKTATNILLRGYRQYIREKAKELLG